MPNKILYSIDVEPDLHTGKYLGIRLGLKKFEKICDKYNVKPVLFVVASIIKDNKEIFKKWHKKGWDISLHGYSHKRFDEMNLNEKEREILKSIEIFKKYLGIKPKGFRAPQHSIDEETLDLLEKHGFEYDSSYTPLNIMQIIFFPKKIKLFFKQFFSKINPYRIRENLLEVPVPGILIPPVSLFIRIFPRSLMSIYLTLIKILFKKPVFYAHSWDFIELKQSRIDKIFNHKRFISNLEYVMSQHEKQN